METNLEDQETTIEKGGQGNHVDLHIKRKGTVEYRFTMKVDKNISVAEIKETINKRIGLSIDEQRLKLDGKLLQDSWTLCDCYKARRFRNTPFTSFAKDYQANGIAISLKVIPEKVQVHIDRKGERRLTLLVNRNLTVLQVKELIADQLETTIAQQTLKYAGKLIDDSWTLSDCFKVATIRNLTSFATILGIKKENCPLDGMVFSLKVKETAVFLNRFSSEKYFFDPTRDLDFRDSEIKPLVKRICGGKPYNKPKGSYLKALKVWDEFEDNNWLGDAGKKGEWAVAYHGTNIENVIDIIRSGGLKEIYSSRQSYGAGIYCSPDPTTALEYTEQHEFEGEQYKIIFQVRVDPDWLTVVPPTQHKTTLGDYWIVPEEKIRLYGLCIYLIKTA